MVQAIYRKWRPATFSELVGQEHIKTILTNALKSKRIVHAYLFYGPRGTGKTTVARLLAKSTNCEYFKGEPCRRCSSCKDFQEAKTMDLVEIDAASNRGIEEIKDLREKVKFLPTRSKYKVFVIDEVHMLTKEAFNALLKVLEEPPPHIIFVLATTEVHKVPQTILSRCQRLDFKRISKNDLVKRLSFIAQKEKVKLEEGAKELIAGAAEGSARDAESLLDLIISRGLSKITEKDAEQILGRTESEKIQRLYQLLLERNSSAALSLVNEMAQEGRDLAQLNSNLVEFLREKLVEDPSFWLSQWIRILCQAQLEMKHAPFVQLPLELAIVEMVENSPFPSQSSGNKQSTKPPNVSRFRSGKVIRAKGKNKEDGNDEGSDSRDKTVTAADLDWQKVISNIKGYNNSLCFILENCSIAGIKDGQLILCVDFEFHRDKLQEPKNKKIIEDVVKKIAGRDLRVVCNVQKGAKSKFSKSKSKNQGLMSDVEGVFDIE